jgi:hypothetical protein
MTVVHTYFCTIKYLVVFMTVVHTYFCTIKYLVVFMTVVHTYFYIVVDTQRGCHTLKFKMYSLIEHPFHILKQFVKVSWSDM